MKKKLQTIIEAYRKIKSPLDYFGFYVSVLFHLGLIPLSWNFETRKLEYSKEPVKQILVKCLIAIHLCQFVYECVILIWEITSNAEIHAYIFVLLAIILSTIITVPALILCKNGEK